MALRLRLGDLRERLFPRRDLARVVDPTPVVLDGVVDTEDETTSPMSGQRAAVLRWAFYEALGAGGATRIRGIVEPLATGWLGPPGRGLQVRVAGRGPDGASSTVEVPIDGLVLRREERSLRVHPVGAALPETFADALAAAGRSPGAVLFYGEVLFHHGDPVRLRATVSVPCRGAGSPYRTASRIDYVAHGTVAIERR